MSLAVDLTGKTFERLAVIGPVRERDSKGGIRWLCRCDCGNVIIARGAKLRSGRTKPCGCLWWQKLEARNKANSLQPRTLPLPEPEAAP